MAESFVEVSTGNGLKLHTNSRAIGANTVHDEVTIQGEHYLATYVGTADGGSPSVATAGTIAVLYAGATLNLRVRRIRLFQADQSTTSQTTGVVLRRTTTIPTGGTTTTPNPLETTDAACGARLVSNPTGGAALSSYVGIGMMSFPQTEPINATPLTFDFDLDGSKSLIIAAGTANGVAVVTSTNIVGGAIVMEWTFVETSW